MKKVFFRRILSRGYPPSFILKNYKKIPFTLRKTIPYNKHHKNNLTPIIFKLRYTKNISKLGIHKLLKELYQDLLLDPKLSSLPRPFIC